MVSFVAVGVFLSIQSKMFRQKLNWICSTKLLSKFYSINRKQFNVKSDFFENFNVDKTVINELEQLNTIRKSQGSIEILRHLFKNYENETDHSKKIDLRTKLVNEIKKFPNHTHPTVEKYGAESDPIELYCYGDLHTNPIPNGKTYEELCTLSNTMRMSQLGNFTGSRSYYFMHSVAELEQALIRYTTDILFKEGFELISVPDILPAELIKGCGMSTDGHRHQVNHFSMINRNIHNDKCITISRYIVCNHQIFVFRVHQKWL